MEARSSVSEAVLASAELAEVLKKGKENRGTRGGSV